MGFTRLSSDQVDLITRGVGNELDAQERDLLESYAEHAGPKVNTGKPVPTEKGREL